MQPISLIPWQTDFIPALGKLLVERDDFSQCTILFPHNRPRRYLKAYFKANNELPRPVFLPHMTSIAEFVGSLRRDLTDVPVTPVHQLDLVELLRKIVSDLRQTGRGLLARLPEMDRESFLPWGIRLAKLMDDLLRQDIEPEDLHYMEGEVSTYASGLLEQLGALHHQYVTRLFELNWTTSGLDWRFITKNINDISTHLNGKKIIAAGFYALSGAEDLFFRRLWEDNILIPIIHSDPALESGMKPHWAAAEHIEWLKRWKVKAAIPAGATNPDRQPDIKFCEGFDRHSQLAALSDDMLSADDLDNSAVILPDEGALLPVLHHLPDKEPNISMGYPLNRTSLARLIETLLNLQENKLPDGRYYWKDVIGLIRHPYLRLLGPQEKPLRKIFHVWEAAIRQGERYIQPLHWTPPYGDPVLDGVNEGEAESLRQTVLGCCLTNFSEINSLETLGKALSHLAIMLHEHGDKLWSDYLVDAECLFRLTSSVVPQLRSVQSKDEEFSRTTLFSLLRNILSQERVSFEAEPLDGLQVLGVLETRLLHFKRLFILDAVEERLPGTNPYDPLLPDPLRKLLGLPDARERDNVSGYNFYRLLMGADEAVIYYQNGIQPGLLDSKSVRSRFVEQLVWEREKEKKEIIETGSDLIRTVTFPAGSLLRTPKSIPATETIRSLLLETLQKRGLSPSRLDQYMKCPKQFFYTYLSKVRPIEKVNEDGDRSEYGSLIHEVLREYLTPYVGRMTDLAALPLDPLLALFEERFRESDFTAALPYDTRMALTKTGRHRLQAFLESQQPANIVGLEKRLDLTVSIGNLTIPLTGHLDRVEAREEGIYILDYKTGGGVLPKKSLWDDDEIWHRVSDFSEKAFDPLLLTDMATTMQSIQLPLYMHLYSECESITPHEAGLIKLADNGKLETVFNKKITEAKRDDVINHLTPRLVKMLITHMTTAESFAPQPGRNCQWCDFSGPCGQ
jgi:hypothetical protein